MATRDHGDFSNVEAGFAMVNVPRRRISLEDITYRHAQDEEPSANDLDLNFDVTSDTLPLHLCSSMHAILPALHYSAHMANPNNFSDQTTLECFNQSEHHACLETLNDNSLNKVLATFKEEFQRPPTTNGKGRLLVFFVPLTASQGSSYGTKVSMQRSSTQRLLDTLGANPECLSNVIGRPDYWAPQTRWQCNLDDELEICDYFCQHPRWNQQRQGAPLSVYMIRHIKPKMTAYIISYKMGDTSIHALQQMLKLGIDKFDTTGQFANGLANPFEIAVMLSSLSFEASKFHLGKFRRYMWHQINTVDDHLAEIRPSDRGRLAELTKSLQIISQQADAHLLNSNIAIITAMGIRDAQARLHNHLQTPIFFRQPAEDAIKYVIDCMEKQKMLFLNYKDRKNSTMNLVYNLVTQRDAANNIEVALSMKRDSTSMSAIACLTMIFLPGTFTSSILSAGIFSARANSDGFNTSNLWWLWVALTVPLTVIVLLAWWIYKRRSEHVKEKAAGEDQSLKV